MTWPNFPLKEEESSAIYSFTRGQSFGLEASHKVICLCSVSLRNLFKFGFLYSLFYLKLERLSPYLIKIWNILSLNIFLNLVIFIT